MVMTMTFPQLFSKLAVAPLYIMVLIICIGYLIFTRRDKGLFVFLGRMVMTMTFPQLFQNLQ